MSRIYAREAATKIANEGITWIGGAGDTADLEDKIGLTAIYRAQAGLLGDMDYVADVLYGRVST